MGWDPRAPGHEPWSLRRCERRGPPPARVRPRGPEARQASAAARIETFVALLEAADHPVPGWNEEILHGRELPANLR